MWNMSRQFQEKMSAKQKETKEAAVPAQPTTQTARRPHVAPRKNVSWAEGRERHKEDTREHRVYYYSDYMFFSRDGNVEDVEEGKTQKGLITVLTAICKDSQSPFSLEEGTTQLSQWYGGKSSLETSLMTECKSIGGSAMELGKSPRYSPRSRISTPSHRWT